MGWSVLLIAVGVVIAADQHPAHEPPLVLGPLIHARGAVHALDRASLTAELDERHVSHSAEDSDDQLRVKLYRARAELLEHRNTHVMHANRVLTEIEASSSMQLVSDLSLDSILADDNALFADSLRRRVLWELKVETAAGTAIGLLLVWFAPLGSVRPLTSTLLPLASAFGGNGRGGIALASITLLGVLQIATRTLRRLAGDISVFGQKLTAVACREGIYEYVAEVDEQARHAATSASGISPTTHSSSWSISAQSLLLRPNVAIPLFFLCSGSSIFEEVAFRGLLLHALHTKAGFGHRVALALSSVLFGLAHVGNERGLFLRAVYAGWTCLGGAIFGCAYLDTRGGFLIPILLHFVNNALTFGVSICKVAAKLLGERQAYGQMLQRVADEQVAGHSRRSRAATAVGGAGSVTSSESRADPLERSAMFTRLPATKVARPAGEHLYLAVPRPRIG